jgi:hypothetical protein
VSKKILEQEKLRLKKLELLLPEVEGIVGLGKKKRTNTF